MSSETTGKRGFGIGTMLFLIFLVLKLTKQIDWSWTWVTAPLWIPMALIAIIGFLVVTIVAITK